jgi:hypothetical protein
MSNEKLMWMSIVLLIVFWAFAFYALFSKKQNPLLGGTVGPQGTP